MDRPRARSGLEPAGRHPRRSTAEAGTPLPRKFAMNTPPDYSCAICANFCRLCTNPALGRPKKRTHSRRRRAFADESQQLCSGRDFWPGHGESCRAAGVTACRRASTVPATSVETGGSCRSGGRLMKTFSDKKRICADCAQPAPRGHLKKRTHFYRMRASGTAGPPTFRMTHGNAESG